MRNFLDKIKILKQEEVQFRKAQIPLRELRARLQDLPPTRNFFRALQKGGISLIAEIKKASPSAGKLLENLDLSLIARAYQDGGAAAISVLTDSTHFGGELAHIRAVKEAVSLPVLRKDFILDEYQIYESRAAGADAFLLIAELVGKEEIQAFLNLAKSLGFSCLAEAHGRRELEKLMAAGAEIIGINNRDLKTLRVDFETSLQLLPLIPDDRIKVSESGIKTRKDVELLSQVGADAVLVGETLVRSKNKVGKIRELKNKI